MLAIRDREDVVRPLTTAGLIGLISAAALVGGFTTNALAWIGRRELSPAYRLTALETEDSVLSNRIDGLSDQVDIVSEMTLMLVAMRCLDADSVQAAQRARVPCARILRDQGIRP